MMKTLKTQVLRGPNIWSNNQTRLIQLRLDLEEMENDPSDKIKEFIKRCKTLFPKTTATFLTQAQDSASIPHAMEYVANQIQLLAGMDCKYGHTKETNTKGIYTIVFSYTIEEAGLYAAEAAFRIVASLAKEESYDYNADVTVLKALASRYGLGPSTKSIVDEAQRRNIPWVRLGRNSKIQLGHGAAQKQFQATMTCHTSDAAVRLAGNKEATKRILDQHFIPVADGGSCRTVKELRNSIHKIGFPIVIKPLDGNQGKGASINILDVDAALIAFRYAKKFSKEVIVEKYIAGSDYRLLVIDGKFTAAAKRIPALVEGDGVNSIEKLILAINNESKRGNGHESSLTKINIDHNTLIQLEKYGYTTCSIPKKGEIIYLKSTANLSTGGTAIDMTDEIHPENKFLAERIAKIIGLDICGIDIMAPSIEEPLRTNGGVVLEVNAAPGFRMHLNPSVGKPRNVASAVIDMLYPKGSQWTIPLFAVTGTNGKTTTTRLLAHIAKTAGYTPGYTTTDGIYINGYKIKGGDTTGPLSGATILRDPTVNFAVLETARGGLLRSGLCFDQCDVGIITNIQEDHLGLEDIHTLDDLSNVKAVVARSVKKKGWAILNAEDKYCLKMAGTLECNIAYFAMDSNNEIIQECIKNNVPVGVQEANYITIIHGTEKYKIESIVNIPLTNNGNAGFMIANVLTASIAAYVWGFSIEQIKQALLSFIPGYEMTPGRMNFFQFKNYTVLVDYAHNPHGFLALKEYLKNCNAKRKIGIIAGIGDRREEDTIALAKIATSMFDHIIVRQEHSLRGKTLDEINALVIRGIASGEKKVTYDLVPEEAEAIVHAFNIVKPGDLIVALSDQYDTVIKIIQQKLDIETVPSKYENEMTI